MASKEIITDALMSPILREYRNHKLSVEFRSPKTVEEYLLDLRIFFKFIIASRKEMETEGPAFDNLKLHDTDLDFVKSIKRKEIYDYLSYVRNVRGDSQRTSARKLSSVKMLFKYLCTTMQYFKDNPAVDIEQNSIRIHDPKFMSLEESRELLDAIVNDEESKTKERDFAIIMTFLNTGVRLAELVGMNIEDFDKDFSKLLVTGKRNKQRVVYINDGVRDAIFRYLDIRLTIDCVEKGKRPLFLSGRKQRISHKTVQWLVYKYLGEAGLSYKRLSTHKLRHTAATIMYRDGGVDVRVLQEILGHEQLNTTQIYTHVINDDLEKAANSNPLGKYKPDKD